MPFYKRQIDSVILSHYHDDHIVGLVEVIKRYRVKKLIYAFGSMTSPALSELLSVAENKSLSVLALENQARLSYKNGCFLDLLNPLSLGIKADNNNSLVERLNCDNQTILFTGDNSSNVEKALVNSGWDLKATILKAAHHGSNSANSELFLRVVRPRWMIVSVGVDNKFRHPAPLVLERMVNLGILTARTDKLGTVRIFGR